MTVKEQIMDDIKLSLFLIYCSSLSVNHILLFLARPWLHAGSCDPLLYQHRARCTLGDSCLPFIIPGYRDASLVCVLAACVRFLDTQEDHILWVYDWARADYVFAVWMCLHECEYVWISVLANRCEHRDQVPSLSQGSQGACHFKGPQGSPCQPARQGGNPVYMARPRLARPVANTTLWHLHRLPPPRQV